MHHVVFCGVLKEDEIYWPEENASLTFGHTTVTHRGTECKGDHTRIALEVERFKQVKMIKKYIFELLHVSDVMAYT